MTHGCNLHYVQAKATAKAAVVSKAKVKPIPKVETPAPPDMIMATPTAGKFRLIATVQEVAAPKKPRGVVAKVTGATRKMPALKKTVNKVRASLFQ